MLECFGQESVPPSTVEIELQQIWVYTFGQNEIEVCPTGVFNTINGSTSRGISLMVKHQKGSFKCRQTPMLWILKTLSPKKRPKRLVATSIVLIEEAGFILVRTTYHFLLVPPQLNQPRVSKKNLGFKPKDVSQNTDAWCVKTIHSGQLQAPFLKRLPPVHASKRSCFNHAAFLEFQLCIL